ncbi:MAG: hypothetical protein Q9220_004029 [cf. Caloplaca sp. 1 TL-2023]
MNPLFPAQQTLRPPSSSTPTHNVAMGARRDDPTNFSHQSTSSSASSSSTHPRPQHPLSAPSSSLPGSKITVEATSASDGLMKAASSIPEQQRSRTSRRYSSPEKTLFRNTCNSPTLLHRTRHPARSKNDIEPVEGSAPIRHRPHAKREKREGPECLWSASLYPPVTQDSLSELDLHNIINGRLRHDLMFEHDIIFRPNDKGDRRRQRESDEKEYFNALTIELAQYINRQKCHSPSPSQSFGDSGSATPYASIRSRPPQRIPVLLTTICEIVKTLVPAAKWQTVDEQFDVDLRMQELEHGICDIAGLIGWLGKLMLCSCSPMRDPMVTAMVENTQQAVEVEDAAALVSAIRELFAVLETMKLDVANHQIRYLRFYLLGENIEFEQNQILDRVAAGWPVIHDRRWYETTYEDPEREAPFLMFKEQVLSRIVTPEADFPTTFASDSERLSILQFDFRLCHYHVACGHTFTYALRQLGWKEPPPTAAYVQCMQHVGAIIGTQGRKFDFGPYPDVALEIVRGAYELCKKPGLPSSNILFNTGLYFKEALDSRTHFYLEIEDGLWEELSRLVHAESDAIFNMTPLDILNRYDPGPNQRPTDIGLEGIAKRAAHVIVLHWRVWAPILYNQPDHQGTSILRSQLSPTENETSSRIPRLNGSVSTKASKPVIVAGSSVQHRSKTASLSDDTSETDSEEEVESVVETTREEKSRTPSM